MRFEWDELKREANIDKHGLDFLAAAAIFDGRAVLMARSGFGEEERFLAIAMLDSRMVTVIWTPRPKDTIRIISVRRARDGEERKYRELFD